MEQSALRVGIVGMGTIGRAIAHALDTDDIGVQVAALTSRDMEKARAFAATLQAAPPVSDLPGVIAACDLVIEAATQAAMETIAPLTLAAGKDLMVLSAGALLDHPEWGELVAQHGAKVYIPSGAIVGLDGVKGACVGQVKGVTITTRKPPQGLAGAPYVEDREIDVWALTEETLIFDGSAREACKGFPANVNVSAALSLAGVGPDQTRIRIFAVPGSTRNMHDIEVEGEFGRMTAHIENVPSDTNPRTGKLSYLSAIALLKEIVSPIRCGS
jgi:aspartate dehydrogenase